MALNVDVNGVPIQYPQTGDVGWGDNATSFAEQVATVLGKIGQSQAPVNDDIIVSPGNLSVTSGNLSVGGDASVAGTTSLTGNVTLTNDLTVNGNSTLGNGVLYVDPTYNRVGINDTTPSQALDVTGNVAITGNETVGGTLNVTGATTLSDILGVTGDVAVNTNKFNVTASSGNTLIAGTLGVTGVETITNTTDATNSTSGALIVSGGIGIAKKLYVGTDLSVGGSLSVTGGINPPYWNIVNQKASGTPEGAFTSGAWRTRDLNTTIGNNTITGSSLSTNQFTLPSGTYRIFASAPTYAVNNHKAKLRNITDSTDTLIGTSEISHSTNDGATRSFVSGTFTIASQKTFELQHRCSTSSFFGQASSFSVNEIYSTVELWKLA